MKRTLVLLMRKSPALFQKTLLAFIERLLTLEVDDSHVRNFYLLLTRVFNEFVQERDRASKYPAYIFQLIVGLFCHG